MIRSLWQSLYRLARWQHLARLLPVLALVLSSGVEAQTVAVPALFSLGASTVSATTGANVTLYTANLPANTLVAARAGTPGPTLWRLHAWGHVANNANAKTVRLQVAGVTVDSAIITASAANNFGLWCHVAFRTAGPTAGNQSVYCRSEQGPTTPTSIFTGFQVSLDPTIDNAFTIQIANQTAGSDVLLDGALGELVN